MLLRAISNNENVGTYCKYDSLSFYKPLQRLCFAITPDSSVRVSRRVGLSRVDPRPQDHKSKRLEQSSEQPELLSKLTQPGLEVAFKFLVPDAEPSKSPLVHIQHDADSWIVIARTGFRESQLTYPIHCSDWSRLVPLQFQVLFYPFIKALFTFPSRYLCAIGLPFYI